MSLPLWCGMVAGGNTLAEKSGLSLRYPHKIAFENNRLLNKIGTGKMGTDHRPRFLLSFSNQAITLESRPRLENEKDTHFV